MPRGSHTWWFTYLIPRTLYLVPRTSYLTPHTSHGSHGYGPKVCLTNYLDPQVMKLVDGSPMLYVTLDLEMDENGGDVLFTPDYNNDRRRSNVRQMIVMWLKVRVRGRIG